MTGAAAADPAPGATSAGRSTDDAARGAALDERSADAAPGAAPLAGAGLAWRSKALDRLASHGFDVLVVGGGATGVAVARDAVLRGLTVALVERGDFAGRTSSASSKLIHGGLRYLQYGDLGLVFEALRERRILMTIAPHLCRPVDFVFPVWRGTAPSRFVINAGVALYDALALWRPPARSRSATARELFDLLPGLRTAGLLGGPIYTDCATDDARLVLETALDAEAAGAVVASYVEVTGLLRDAAGRVRGARCLDRESDTPLDVRATTLVNATGPFSDAFGAGGHRLRPTLGVHLTFDARRLPTGGRAVVLRSPRDGRMVFTLPAGPRTFVGTTDTDWRAPDGSERPPAPADAIEAAAADVDYLLETARAGWPGANLAGEDVLSAWAGLRPLVARGARDPSSISREHEIDLGRDDVMTIAGGKLTTMRSMAEEAVDLLGERLAAHGREEPLGRCLTRTRPLPGAGVAASGRRELAGDVADRLAGAYGSRAGAVLDAADADPSLLERIEPDLPYLWAEVVFAARRDRAVRLEDALARRVPLLRDARDQGLGASARAAELMGACLGWTAARRAAEQEAYAARVSRSRAWHQRP